MNGVNQATLLGNVGADPEVRHTQGGTTVANIRMATSESYKDKDTGERKEVTEWHTVTMWGALADVVEKYVKKGSKLYIQGKLKTRKWTDKEGRDRYSTEIIAETMVMVGDKKPEQPPTP